MNSHRLGFVFNVCSLPRNIGYMCDGNTSIDHFNAYNYSSIDLTASDTRFYFDHLLDECLPFRYYGCGGNWNKFHTEIKCTAHCSKFLFVVLANEFSIEIFRTIP